jgi:hypothetical protein
MVSQRDVSDSSERPGGRCGRLQQQSTDRLMYSGQATLMLSGAIAAPLVRDQCLDTGPHQVGDLFWRGVLQPVQL